MQEYLKKRIDKIKLHLLKGGKYEDLTNADFMLAKNHTDNFKDIIFKNRKK